MGPKLAMIFCGPHLDMKFNVSAVHEFHVNGTLPRCVWEIPLLHELELNEPPTVGYMAPGLLLIVFEISIFDFK